MSLGLDDAGSGDQKQLAPAHMDGADFKRRSHGFDCNGSLSQPQGSLGTLFEQQTDEAPARQVVARSENWVDIGRKKRWKSI
jgi:hypothetical protein